jgi:pimeloyl-ACP methyl ester carboxylesterase
VSLVADAFGDPANVPVVLLHGGGQTRQSWRDTGAELAAAGWYVLSVDQRGHGESGWSTAGNYGLDWFGRDVLNIVRTLEGKPVLVGASLGGLASLVALAEQPDLALGLVLVDVSPFLNGDGRDHIVQFMRGRPEGYTSVEEVADAVADYLPYRERPASLAGLERNLRARDGRLFWHWDPAFLSTERELTRREVWLGAAAMMVRVPTLLIRGAHSDVLGLDDAQRFLSLVPHVEFAEIEGAHHMVAGDENTVFGVVVKEFLERRIRSRIELMARRFGSPDDPEGRE